MPRQPILNLEAEFGEWMKGRYGMSGTRTDWLNQTNTNSPFIAAAFVAGARVMAQDTLYTLDDYAAFTSGVEEGEYSLADCFDKAQTNLHVYYTKVLDDFDEDLGKWCE